IEEMLIEREKYSEIYSVEEICHVHGISRQSYYQWKKREIKEGSMSFIVGKEKNGINLGDKN
ncbi:helix-turn-helix domain-containing protein, partial [Phenylobacterium sp.]|uniref:helix-turn-helix domain-containing protein n=1 Tax=Phenylobacterium sp. TaxID=1871053 RepID=UPI0027344106